MKTYKVIDGMSFDITTPDEVCKLLVRLNKTRERVKIHYGDHETGVDWLDEFYVTGTIGKSGGICKIPLMIHNTRSKGGFSILDKCIVKIKGLDGRILYKTKNYKELTIEIVDGDLTEYPYNTLVNGKLFGRHKTLRSANMLKKKLM